jgi:hypothetical protein
LTARRWRWVVAVSLLVLSGLLAVSVSLGGWRGLVAGPARGLFAAAFLLALIPYGVVRSRLG